MTEKDRVKQCPSTKGTPHCSCMTWHSHYPASRICHIRPVVIFSLWEFKTSPTSLVRTETSVSMLHKYFAYSFGYHTRIFSQRVHRSSLTHRFD